MIYSIISIHNFKFDSSFVCKMARITKLSAMEKVKCEVTLHKMKQICFLSKWHLVKDANEVRACIKYIFYLAGFLINSEWKLRARGYLLEEINS